jgi:hypothetical protein
VPSSSRLGAASDVEGGRFSVIGRASVADPAREPSYFPESPQAARIFGLN